MAEFIKSLKQPYWILCTLAILLSIFISYKMRWLGDDIFIGLRYVKNFNAGHGWVYNIGERVEGYTDFLWLLLVSGFSALKFDAASTTLVLGIVFSAATLILFSLIGFKIVRNKGLFILPFVTLALVANYDVHVWATSGLEVSFVIFLVSMAFYIYFFSALSDNKRLIFSGLFISLALMTRPDVMLILIFTNVLLFVKNLLHKTAFTELVRVHLLYNLATLLIYLPYFLWRYNYYGFIFPNTYYDKLGYETAYAQGFIYLWLYFKCHYTSFLLLLPLFTLFPLIRKQGLRNFLLQKEYSPLLVAFSTVLVYLLLFVAKVGGDFMYARFIMLTVPFIYFIIFYSLVLTRTSYLNPVLTAILLLTAGETYIRMNLFIEKGEDGRETVLFPNGVADERYCYLYCSKTDVEVQRGKEISAALRGIDYKAIIFGAQARFGYYAEFPYIQEYFGLTDTLIAHMKIPERGRIGHEKHGSIEYFEGKKINFSFQAGTLKEDPYRQAQLELPSGTVNMEIITYDNALIAKMRQQIGTRFKYVDFPNYLDAYIKDSLPLTASYDQLDQRYKSFHAYYFKNNADPERERMFALKLNELKTTRRQ